MLNDCESQGQQADVSLPNSEVAAINNCSQILTDPNGEYRLSGADALKAFRGLSLYTNAEPCPMVHSLKTYCYPLPLSPLSYLQLTFLPLLLF